MAEDAYIGIGSNMGDRVRVCLLAVREIHRLPYTRVVAVSSLYETQPVGASQTAWFINGAAHVKTDLPPLELMRACLKIEETVGRIRVERGEPRPLDLDLLLYGMRFLVADEVTVPHPRMASRRFVLEPLAEINREIVHPLLNKTIGTLLSELEDPHTVLRIQPVDLEEVLAL